MAVVINEFEVVPGESAAQESGSTPGSEGAAAAAPSAREIALLIEQQLQRAERIWAH
ncbi:MAG TPA: hypothetical protein VFI24_27255 [Pyrinomonadaceae bacterium]|nr:hypothetical protein [Pyrinomonadaceae bacterium]